MSDAATYWFSPAPSQVSSSRLSLDFELRAADLFFRELVVPELGRIWFARQLSWPLAALALHEDLASHGLSPPKPTAICHGIEALACKLEYFVDPQDPSRRILGRRAFARDAEREVWSFLRLRQGTNYVRNTHRQAATRALRIDGGLGFASGSRFDLLKLEPVGRALANAFLEQRVGKGGTSLRKWLFGWLEGDREISGWPKTLLQALSPEYATDDERALVRSRLLGTFTPASEKRRRLARAIGRAVDLPSIEDGVVGRLREAGHREQANEVVAARAFGAVLDRARDAVARLTRAVEPGRGGVKLSTLARDSLLKRSIKDLRTASKNYVDKANTAGVNEATSRSFSNAVVAGDDAEAIGILARRSGDVIGIAAGSVTRGSLFRVLDGADEASDLEDGAASIEPDRTGRTFRIANLHSLLRDVDRRGAG
ncbi:hypothetical protein ACM43_12185 [Bradyrhizobium sp. CCBAU 45321]|uniref:hypothetical protein n=1 Tax=Bradyrhizobium sp. CCBAU 45321 TaxID=1641878 RepID=UPI0023040AA3|nr:hypothetical protein [Bradyrhizobium sp. CCBAU 45321]MDA9545187.1 hypothetical protein [Bradyrhizobium sp. CCBAU 45321]